MNRRRDDAYYTPHWVTRAILEWVPVKFEDIFLEPCIGNRAIADFIPLLEGQLRWAEKALGRDYLDPTFTCPEATLIITNPPFVHALEFLTKSLADSPKATVCYLLRLDFLGSQKRRSFWWNHPPTHLMPLSRRPSFTGGATDSRDYGWFVWDRDGRVRTTDWLKVL